MKIEITRIIKYLEYNYIEGYINGGLVSYHSKDTEIVTDLNLIVGSTYKIKTTNHQTFIT